MSLISTSESSRKRTVNFSSKEVDILINLVAKYKDRIECKKTDRTSNITKNEAWHHLEKEFNSFSGGTYRDGKILRNKYENIKKGTKQRFADEKVYRRGTGGGPEKPFVITEVDEKLKDIIGTQITGLVSEFDGDRENFSSTDVVDIDNMEISILEEPQSVIESYEMSNEDEQVAVEIPASRTCWNRNYASTSSVNDSSAATSWAKYIPSQLRTPKSVPLKTKLIANKNKENIGKCSSQAQLSNKVITWASSKAEIANEHLIFLREEHDLKLKQMREKHQLDMAIAREESEERRKYFVQQAELQLEILRQQLEKK